MRVEFSGISGVGKTTVAKKYVEEFRNEGNNVEWPWNLIYSDKIWIRRNFKKSFMVIKMLVSKGSWCLKLHKYLKTFHLNARDLNKLFFNGAYLKGAIDKCRNHECIYIFDEGVVQYIYAICFRTKRTPDNQMINEAFSLFNRPDELIIVSADSKTIYNRLINRKQKDRIRETNHLLEDIDIFLNIENTIKNILFEEKIVEKITVFDNN